MAANDDSEKGLILSEAIAEYFDVEPETIQGYLIGVERVTEEGGLFFSSIWSVNKPMWQLSGFADELKHHVEKQRPVEVPANGEVESRQVRRARSRGRGKRQA
jgi:hypothetical protein